MLIPQTVLDAYVERFPHLKRLVENIDNPRAARTFAQNACRLSAPPKVSVGEIYALAGVAEGLDWQLPGASDG